MLKYFYLLFLLLLIILNCHENKNRNILKLQLNKKAIKISKIFNTSSFKFFNAPDSIVIGAIDKYFKVKSYQILIDRKYSKGIYIFDDRDEFIGKIDSHGEAPDEFINIDDCTVSDENIFLLDITNKKINVYTIPDGKYVKSIALVSYIGGIIYFKGYLYAYTFEDYSGKNYFLIRINMSTGEVLPVIKNIPKILKAIPTRGINHFDIYKNELYFFPPYSNKIYKIDENGDVFVEFVFENHEMTESIKIFKSLKKKYNIRANILKKYTTIQNFYITDKYIFLNLPINQRMYQGFILKNIREGNLYSDFVDDINNIGIGVYIYNNLKQYMTYIQVNDILTLYENIKFYFAKNNKKIPHDLKIKSIVEKIKNENIPIVLIYNKRGANER